MKVRTLCMKVCSTYFYFLLRSYHWCIISKGDYYLHLVTVNGYFLLTVIPYIVSRGTKFFDIFTWGNYWKVSKILVVVILTIFWKNGRNYSRGNVIQRRILIKEIRYIISYFLDYIINFWEKLANVYYISVLQLSLTRFT